MKAVPHKTIQFEIGRINQQDPKSQNFRRRSRSDKSGRVIGSEFQNENFSSFKKKHPPRVQPPIRQTTHQTAPQDTPNKIFKKFYPFAKYADASNEGLK